MADAPSGAASIRMLNADYLVTALAVLEAAYTEVTLRLGDPLHPIVLSSDNGIDIVILPCMVTA
ncbi:hypothetical protein D3C84_1019550 [compost metagenome]